MVYTLYASFTHTCTQLSQLTNKPMVVAETSTVSGHDVNKGIAYHYYYAVSSNIIVQ